MRRWVKNGAMTLGVISVFIAIAVGVMCYLVVTPARLTGIVNRLASRYLTCELAVEKVDLTVFSSFPDISLQLENVFLVNPLDEHINDTVVAIERCEAIVDIKRLFSEEAIVVRKFCIKGGEANLYIDTDGNANFMVLEAQESVAADTAAIAAESPSNMSFELPETELREVVIDDVDVTYRNEVLGQFAVLEDFGLALNGQLKKDMQRIVLESSLRRVEVVADGETAIEAAASGISVELDIATDGKNGDVGGKVGISSVSALSPEMNTAVNNVEWNVVGALKNRELQASTILTTSPMQLTLMSEALVDAVLDAVEFRAEVTADCAGTVSLTPELVLPGLTLSVGKDVMLEQAAIGLTAPIHTDTAMQSFSITDARFELNDYQVSMNGGIDVLDSLTWDADLQFVTNLWNIPRMLALVPDNYRYLLEDIQVNDGNAVFQGAFRGLKRSGSLKLDKADASLALQDFDILYNDSLALQSQAADISVAYIGSRDCALGNIVVDDVEVAVGGMVESGINTLKSRFTLKGVKEFVDGKIDAEAQIAMNELTASLDTIGLYTQMPVIDVAVRQDGADAVPTYRAAISCDTLYTAMGKTITVSMGPLAIGADAIYDSTATDVLAQWKPQLDVALYAGSISSPMLSVPIDIPHIRFDYADGRFIINDSRVLLGNSDFGLQGSVSNIDSFLSDSGLLKADLDFVSSYTDVTQIMDLVSGLGGEEDGMESTMQGIDEETGLQEEEENEPFMVPLGIDVRLNTDIRTANVNGFNFNDVGGYVTVKDGVLVLEEMGFTADAARMQLTAMYKSPRTNHLFVGFDFHLLDIEIDQLVRMIPDVDSIIPMLSAFDGEAQFHFAAETYLRSNYDIKMSTLRAAGAIEGKNLVVMDNETFSQISKLLQFEKKTENVVDSISVELSVFKDKVTLYPFLIAMDDYKAVIGGRHNIDQNLSFDYHISLTECPLPVRLGLDVSGSLDDMKFSLVPCRYAHLYNPEKQSVVQARTLQLKKIISESLKDNVK